MRLFHGSVAVQITFVEQHAVKITLISRDNSSGGLNTDIGLSLEGHAHTFTEMELIVELDRVATSFVHTHGSPPFMYTRDATGQVSI